MKAFVAVSTLLSACSAQILPYGAGYAAPYAAGIAPYAAGIAPYAAGLAPYAAGIAPYAAGIAPYAAAPLAAPYAAAAPAIAAAPSTQFQAQDELRNFNYGYANINSAKQEVGNALTGVAGSYQYVDPNGELQVVKYVADALGFRVEGTNLPVAPALPDVALPVAPVYTGVAPEPVQPTPEVAEATAAHLKALAEAGARKKRSVVAPLAYAAAPYAVAGKVAGVAAPLATATALTSAPLATPTLGYAAGYGYAGLGYAGLGLAGAYAAPALAAAPLAGAYAAPALAAAAPAVPSTLTTIKLNPGHAIAYNVLPKVA